VDFSPDSQRFVTACWDQTVRVWDVATRKQVLSLPHAAWACLGVAWSPDGQTIAGAVNKTIQF
jgi:WD40 repeat protein